MTTHQEAGFTKAVWLFFDGPTYGVTKDCRIPRGVTVGEIS